VRTPCSLFFSRHLLRIKVFQPGTQKGENTAKERCWRKIEARERDVRESGTTVFLTEIQRGIQWARWRGPYLRPRRGNEKNNTIILEIPRMGMKDGDDTHTKMLVLKWRCGRGRRLCVSMHWFGGWGLGLHRYRTDGRNKNTGTSRSQPHLPERTRCTPTYKVQICTLRAQLGWRQTPWGKYFYVQLYNLARQKTRSDFNSPACLGGCMTCPNDIDTQIDWI
jgi:hypothetical protein